MDRFIGDTDKLDRAEHNRVKFHLTIGIRGKTEVVLEILVFFTVIFQVNIPDNIVKVMYQQCLAFDFTLNVCDLVDARKSILLVPVTEVVNVPDFIQPYLMVHLKFVEPCHIASVDEFKVGKVTDVVTVIVIGIA
jgi:hypothetical protein